MYLNYYYFNLITSLCEYVTGGDDYSYCIYANR